MENLICERYLTRIHCVQEQAISLERTDFSVFLDLRRRKG